MSAAFTIAMAVAAEPFAVLPPIVTTVATLIAAALIGYAVSVTLLPDGLSPGGRLVVSLGAALAVPVAGAFVLNVTPWGIGSWQFLVIFVIAFVAAIGIGLRRSPEAWRRPWSIPRVGRGMAIAVALYLVAGAGAIAAIEIRADVASRPVATPTELSLDPVALANGHVEAHVVSHETGTVQFRLDLAVNGTTAATHTEAVGDGEEWVVSLPEARAGDRVTVTLYRLPETESPYRMVDATVPRPGTTSGPSEGH